MDKIIIKGAAENNLKDISIEIPRNKFTVITGISGSGKSSLVYDVIAKEANRRYFRTFSAYARQFMVKYSKPRVEFIDGLSPVISVDQKSVVKNSRSTVGTLTEVYDYLRLAYARLGETNHRNLKLTRSLFSFNSPTGACPACNGLGVEDYVDPELLIADKNKTVREGALVITTPTGYLVYSQVTMDVLNQVCEAHGFNVDIPWKDLTNKQKDIILNGSDRLKIPYGKHTLESRMRWSGITAKPREEGFYKGILPVIEGILKRDRNPNILRFVRSVKCKSCNGSRLNPDALSVKMGRYTIWDLSQKSITELNTELQEIEFAYKLKSDAWFEIKTEILKRLQSLKNLGLGYLTLNRESVSLSAGESQRIRLAIQANSGIQGVLYVFDEPSVGLHPSENIQTIQTLKKLRDKGNTVLVVEHDEETMLHADWIIDIGPDSGINGGQVVFSGTPDDFLKGTYSKSKSWEVLKNKNFIAQKTKSVDRIYFEMKNASLHNLKNIDATFLHHGFNAVTGVSGAGKTSLINELITAFNKGNLIGNAIPTNIIHIDQSPIGKSPRSNPATYTKIFDHIRDFFAALPESKDKKLSKSHFSFNTKGGRCEACQGAGKQEFGMHFMGSVEITCEHCNGKRFNREVLSVKHHEKSIADVLDMSVDDALTYFKNHKKLESQLAVISEIGLGYIKLGQSSSTLSGGESQRIKLSTQLIKASTKNSLYIFDEPTVGLHTYDIKIFLESISKLIGKGHTIIVVEHNLDVIKQADHIIDLGPESGIKGGEIVAKGTIKEVLDKQNGKTYSFLKSHVEEKYIVPKKDTLHEQKSKISIRGLTTNNLKNINIVINRGELTVITGVSGSGKSSLAFDTIFNEGRNRYSESFSTYVRSLIGIKGKPDFESISGITPSVAISQYAQNRSPRSTVGTITGIYDLYRLIYSRLNTSADGEKLYMSQFSFNNESGACPDCKGLGIQKTCDPDKLISHPELKILDGAMNGSKIGKFYGDPFGQYMAILQTIASVKNIDLNLPYNKLEDETQNWIMFGTGETEYQVDWKYKRKNREGMHQFTSTWPGLVFHINNEYHRKHADKRSIEFESILKEEVCQSCNGKRLKNDSLQYKFLGRNISDLSGLSIRESIDLLDDFIQNPVKYSLTDKELDIIREVLEESISGLHMLSKLGLDYLSLSRCAQTLSGGEIQRLQIVANIIEGLTGITYVLDEPSIGLHPHDIKPLINILLELKNRGNSIIIVEHEEEIIQFADHVIELGPKAGKKGGDLIAQGKLSELIRNPNSLLKKYLGKKIELSQTNLTSGFIEIYHANVNNLKNFNVSFPLEAISVITGVSGSGKTSLAIDVLAQSAYLNKAVHCESINMPDNLPVIVVDQNLPKGTSTSILLSYLGLYDSVKSIFANTKQSKEKQLKPSHFSLYSKQGSCIKCKGSGQLKLELDFMNDFYQACEECKGKGFQSEVLNVYVQGKNIHDWISTDFESLSTHFELPEELRVKIDLIVELGLGHLHANQTTKSLSGGELQRVKLLRELIKINNSKKIFIFDEPTTGLHFIDVEQLIKLFRKLVNIGHSLIIVEHNQQFIAACDWIVDLGPESGAKGGELMFAGKPIDFVKNCTSITAQKLKDKIIIK